MRGVEVVQRRGLDVELVQAGLAALQQHVPLVGDTLYGGRAALGDLLGVATAMFYAAYQMTVNRARATITTARIMAVSTTLTALFLVPAVVLSGDTWWPATGCWWAPARSKPKTVRPCRCAARWN